MDAARTINKMGAKSVKVIYRRAEEQMPAEKKKKLRMQKRRYRIFIPNKY